MERPPLLEFRQVSKIYGEGAAAIRALDHVDLSIRAHVIVRNQCCGELSLLHWLSYSKDAY